ncbi:hypothetical protein HDU88_007889 [Geranomyces variabilis]|nr:hypothetical protein HDU88_007889 [Geranomyces variabilis]
MHKVKDKDRFRLQCAACKTNYGEQRVRDILQGLLQEEWEEAARASEAQVTEPTSVEGARASSEDIDDEDGLLQEDWEEADRATEAQVTEPTIAETARAFLEDIEEDNIVEDGPDGEPGPSSEAAAAVRRVLPRRERRVAWGDEEVRGFVNGAQQEETTQGFDEMVEQLGNMGVTFQDSWVMEDNTIEGYEEVVERLRNMGVTVTPESLSVLDQLGYMNLDDEEDEMEEDEIEEMTPRDVSNAVRDLRVEEVLRDINIVALYANSLATCWHGIGMIELEFVNALDDDGVRSHSVRFIEKRLGYSLVASACQPSRALADSIGHFTSMYGFSEFTTPGCEDTETGIAGCEQIPTEVLQLRWDPKTKVCIPGLL